MPQGLNPEPWLTVLDLHGGGRSPDHVLNWLSGEGWRLGAALPAVFAAEVHDSPAGHLARAGGLLLRHCLPAPPTLELRSRAGALGELDRRTPLHQPCPAPDQPLAVVPPGPVAAHLAAAGQPGPWQAQGLLRGEGRAWLLWHATAGRLWFAAWQLRFTRPEAPAATGEESHWLLRLAMPPGSVGEAWHLARLLAKAFPKLVAGPGAIEAVLADAGLGLPAPAAAPAVRPDDCLGQTLCRILDRELATIRDTVGGTCLGLDAEYLHGLRVAVRRLRAALRIFAGVLPAAAEGALTTELRWFGAAMADCRDLDVNLQNLPWYAAGLSPAEAAVLSAYGQRLWQERGAARARMLPELLSIRCAALQATLAHLATAAPDPPAGPAAASTRDAAGACLGRWQKRVLRRGDAALAEPSVEALHRLRIAVKHLRYLGEWLQPLYDDKLVVYTDDLVRLQSLLGKHHDAAVAISRLGELADAARAEAHAEALAAAAELLQRQKREILAKSERDFPRAWGRLRGRRLKRQYIAGR